MTCDEHGISISNLNANVKTIANNADSDKSGTLNTSEELAAFFSECSKKNLDTGLIKTEGVADSSNRKEDHVQSTPHKCNRGWYPATADNNPLINGEMGILANGGKVIINAQDPAGLVAMAVLATKGSEDAAKSNLGKDQLRQMIIKANPSVFNHDGSIKRTNGTVDLGKLDLPLLDQMKSSIKNDDPKRTDVPRGFYPAFKDGQSTISGLNERTLRENAKDRNTAYQVMEAVLQTKGGNTIKADRKVMLLNDLIRKNPSVFNPDGTLKPNADLSKLDIPTLDYMNNNYKTSPDMAGTKYKFDKATGCYSMITKDGKTTYYQANGQEINQNEAKSLTNNRL